MDAVYKIALEQSSLDPDFVKKIEDGKRSIIQNKYTPHPFDSIDSLQTLENLAPEYLAMSQAFPFIQAASQKEVIFDCINNNIPVPQSFEITSVVGNFLTWDETGGFELIIKDGIKGLLKILNTDSNFHSQILQRNFKSALKVSQPNYSIATRKYLKELYNSLASKDPIERVASMIAFETQAEIMIRSLWHSIKKQVPDLSPEELNYFEIHVGIENAAEEYHVGISNLMIERIVPRDKVEDFFLFFDKGLELSINWCKAITNDK